MNPDNEEAIERLVRFPEALSPREREEIEALIRTDPVARELAAFFRSYYDELDDLPEGDPSGEPPPP